MQTFNSLRTYGKEPEQLEGIIAMFNLVLADYSFAQIEEAFAFYLKTSNEMPAPADICNIIERGNKPALDRSVYIAISKKLAEHRTGAEWDYLGEYERFAITGRH